MHVYSRDRRGGQLKAAGGELTPYSLQLGNIGLSCRDWHTVIDVGFNYGEMLVAATLPAGAALFAFEPNPRILPFSRMTLSEFGRPVTLIESAVSDRVGGSIPFSVDLEWSGTSGIIEGGLPPTSAKDHEFTVVPVPVTTLDAVFIDQKLPNVAIKIDVEGHEVSVLTGAAGLLESTPEWLVMLEILHMTAATISQISQGGSVFVLHLPTGRLVRLPAGRPRSMARVIRHPDIYGQDAILVSAERILDGLTMEYSEVLRHSRQSRPARASLLRKVARRLKRGLRHR